MNILWNNRITNKFYFKRKKYQQYIKPESPIHNKMRDNLNVRLKKQVNTCEEIRQCIIKYDLIRLKLYYTHELYISNCLCGYFHIAVNNYSFDVATYLWSLNGINNNNIQLILQRNSNLYDYIINDKFQQLQYIFQLIESHIESTIDYIRLLQFAHYHDKFIIYNWLKKLYDQKNYLQLDIKEQFFLI
jgi:hypothetical protein